MLPVSCLPFRWKGRAWVELILQKCTHLSVTQETCPEFVRRFRLYSLGTEAQVDDFVRFAEPRTMQTLGKCAGQGSTIGRSKSESHKSGAKVCKLPHAPLDAHLRVRVARIFVPKTYGNGTEPWPKVRLGGMLAEPFYFPLEGQHIFRVCELERLHDRSESGGGRFTNQFRCDRPGV